jgi:hypothetical protein
MCVKFLLSLLVRYLFSCFIVKNDLETKEQLIVIN